MIRRLVAIGLVLAMTLVSAFTLGALVVPALWLGRTAICLAITVTVLVLARARTTSPAGPSLLALAVGLLATLAVFFPDAAVLRVLPTRETIEAIGDTIPATLEMMRTSYPPMTSGDGVAFFVAVGVVVVFVLAEMLAVGSWAPAWSGLPVLGLWSVPILLGAPVSALTVALAGLTYVALITLQARDDARHRRRPEAAAVRASAVAVASVLITSFVIAPALLRVPVPIRWHPFYELVGSSTTRLDLGLGLRDDLLRSSDIDLLSYTGAAPETVGPLHAYTVSEFDGSEWVRDDAGELAPLQGQVLWPTSVEDLPLGETFDLAIDIASLGQDRLLLPGEPRILAVDTAADYVAEADEVVARVGGEIGYSVTVLPRLLDDRLGSLRPVSDPPADLLQVPDTGYQADIAELTRQVVADAGASTPYEQLLAIQNYLRDPSVFVYSTTIDAPTTPDAVWDFLNDRHGYCVQFASAMIIMARTLGIPARLAVGFLPGTQGEDGVARISSHDAHAWPQVLFEDVGWVRFEPTPGVQAGDPPEYAPEPESTATATTAPSTAAPTASTATSAGATATSTTSPTATRETGATSTWWLALTAMLLLAVAASLLAGRRARLRGPGLRARWERVLLHLDRIGVDVAASRTPRAIAEDAAEVLDPSSAAAMAALAGAVEMSSYGRPDGPRPTDAEVEEWTEQVVEGTREVMHQQRRERVSV